MEDPSTLQQEILKSYEAREAAEALQQQQQAQYEALQRVKLEELQHVLSDYGDYRYLDLNKLIDPDNKNWADYTYWLGSHNNRIKRQIHIDAGSPEGLFINSIRNAKTIGDVYKQSELWNSYDPLSSHDRARKYFRLMVGDSKSEFPTTNEPDPVQTTAGGTQGVQAGTQTGNGVAKGGTTSTQGTQTGGTSGGTQGAKTGSTGGTYASAGVPRGGTKTIGYDPYDPNPGNVSLAYAMRNAPEQERRTALINKWNQEHGISYATGKDGLIYRTDPQHPNGYVDPFKNDLSKTGSTGYATGQGMLTSSNDGTYATGEGIKDANGNVLTNPGGDWEYQYALKNPQYGLGMMGKMSDAQRNYLQAVSDDMGYNYNFRGATRFV